MEHGEKAVIDSVLWRAAYAGGQRGSGSAWGIGWIDGEEERGRGVVLRGLDYASPPWEVALADAARGLGGEWNGVTSTVQSTEYCVQNLKLNIKVFCRSVYELTIIYGASIIYFIFQRDCDSLDVTIHFTA